MAVLITDALHLSEEFLALLVHLWRKVRPIFLFLIFHFSASETYSN